MMARIWTIDDESGHYEIENVKKGDKEIRQFNEPIKDTCDIENYVKFYIAPKMDD